MSKTKKPTITPRRSMLERVNEIFTFIDKQDRAFPKSKLKEIGLNPNSAENWLRMIEFIQNQPRIRVISSEKNTLVEKIEGKYQAMIRRVITDESIPFEERDLLLGNYLPSLYTREKLGLDRKYNNELEFPRTKNELIQFVKDKSIEIPNEDMDNLEVLLTSVKNWFVKRGL